MGLFKSIKKGFKKAGKGLLSGIDELTDVGQLVRDPLGYLKDVGTSPGSMAIIGGATGGFGLAPWGLSGGLGGAAGALASPAAVGAAGSAAVASSTKKLLSPKKLKVKPVRMEEDKAFLASLAQDEARRRQSMAGRSLLRSSFSSNLGRSGSSVLGKGV